MKDLELCWKGISAVAEFYDDENMFYGKIDGFDDLITFGGKTPENVTKDFINAVEDCLSSRVVRTS